MAQFSSPKQLGFLAAALVAAVAFLLVPSGPQQYESTSRLLVGPLNASRSTLDASSLLTTTFAEILKSEGSVLAATETAGVDRDQIEVKAISDQRSRVIILIVTGRDVETPAVIAGQLADDLVTQVAAAASNSLDAESVGAVRVLAQPNVESLSGDRARWITALALGTLAGAIAAYAASRRSPPVPAEITVIRPFYGLDLGTVNAAIPDDRLRERPGAWTDAYQPGSSAADTFDLCAHRLILATDLEHRGQTFALVASTVGTPEAISTSVLAAALARSGILIDLVDTDLETSELDRLVADHDTTRHGEADERPKQPRTIAGLTDEAAAPNLGYLRLADHVSSPMGYAAAVRQLVKGCHSAQGDRTDPGRRRSLIGLTSADQAGLTWASAVDHVIVLTNDRSPSHEPLTQLLSSVGVVPLALLHVNDAANLELKRSAQ